MVEKYAMFGVRCDGCGRVLEESDECGRRMMSIFGSKDDAVEQAEGCGWLADAGRIYCPDCTVYDEELDGYVPRMSVNDKR